MKNQFAYILVAALALGMTSVAQADPSPALDGKAAVEAKADVQEQAGAHDRKDKKEVKSDAAAGPEARQEAAPAAPSPSSSLMAPAAKTQASAVSGTESMLNLFRNTQPAEAPKAEASAEPAVKQ